MAEKKSRKGKPAGTGAPPPVEPPPAAAPPPFRGAAGGLPDPAEARHQIERTLVKTVIALPLLDKLNAEAPRPPETPPRAPDLYDVIIDAHLEYPTGREKAREWIKASISKLIPAPPSPPGPGDQRIDERKSGYTSQYVFARLSGEVIRELVRRDVTEPKPDLRGGSAAARPARAIYQIWEDFKINPLIFSSVSTVKCDAARAAFGAAGEGIVWAVIDSGIQGDHAQFAKHENLKGQVEEWHLDFTDEDAKLSDGFGHGTHVAGIISGEIPAVGEDFNEAIVAYTRSLKADGADGGREVVPEKIKLKSIGGMAPRTRLVSLKVIDKNGQGSVSSIIAALAHIQKINGNGRYLRIHGVNLSVGYPFDAEWFACGQSQLCVEVNRLVRSGVVVVVAAGNTGYGTVATEFKGGRKTGLLMSINDPGNADYAITVGSTHRSMPHVYGVSYFSSKGPTGDGRIKPDLLAPGEKIVSCAAGQMAANFAAKLDPGAPPPTHIESTGTSMAAPHVSGAVAALLSVKREFIGQPERVKQILVSTATDLGRERHFQGAGLIDLMRAIQSV